MNLIKLKNEYIKAKTEFEQKIMSEMAANIKELREHNNMSQQELAEACDMKRTTITMIENSKQGIDVVQLVWISMALNCDARELIPRIEWEVKGE